MKPRAYVALKAGHAPSPAMTGDLQDFIKKTLAPYKYPRDVVYLESLPKNDRGKVDKKALKA